jgi:cysteine desulfurase
MFYCDYNATFPLADAVKEQFAKGFFFANSSSQHSAGKKTAHLLKKTQDFLFNFFHISPEEYRLVFHSGATEGANHFYHLYRSLPKDAACMMFSPIDHSCFRAPGALMEQEGRSVIRYKLTPKGFVDLEQLQGTLEAISRNHDTKVFLNTTWVHNELGHIEDLNAWAALKKKFNFFWHIDATQSIFKIKDYQNLNAHPDMWTFSGHKFGSLMGVGWSFIKEKTFGSMLRPFVVGGEQQSGLRAGTVNMEGILSLQWALENLHPQFNYSECMKKLLKIKAALEVEFDHGKLGTFFFSEPSKQACNTLSLALNNVTSDISLPAFDMAGIQLGTGAACASGGIKPQTTLNHLGHRALANQYLRFSMNPFINDEQVESLIKVMRDVVQKLNSENK